MIDKKILNQNKHLIKGIEVKVGNKKFKFEGCGPDKIKLSYKISGIDIKKASLSYIWVLYSNLNPVIEKQLIIALRKNGVKV